MLALFPNAKVLVLQKPGKVFVDAILELAVMDESMSLRA